MRSETKKGIRFYNLTPDILVRLAGIEPTTPWFVAKYSIQLSYSRLRQDYSRALQNGKGRGGDISQLTLSPRFFTGRPPDCNFNHIDFLIAAQNRHADD